MLLLIKLMEKFIGPVQVYLPGIIKNSPDKILIKKLSQLLTILA